MKNKQRIINSIMWGACAMVGFVITERIFDAAIKIVNRKEVVDCEIVEIEEESK